jgi:fructokinase
MINPLTIVGLGEALFDVMGDRVVLGGAPLNVAVHAHQVAAVVGGCGVLVSRVGADAMGQRVLREIGARGMTAEYLQIDRERPTGTVHVDLSGPEPAYEIVRHVAWDHLQASAALDELAEHCAAVCFGTLAQREEDSRRTIRRFLERAQQALRLFDVNLRQDYFSADILQESCRLATVVKLNEQELPIVVRQLGLETGAAGCEPVEGQAQALRCAFGLDAVALTQGPRGTDLYTGSGRIKGDPVSYEANASADSVGAGDACSAGLLLGMLLDWPPRRTLSLANHMGGFVAAQPGATPVLPQAILDMCKGQPASEAAREEHPPPHRTTPL